LGSTVRRISVPPFAESSASGRPMSDEGKAAVFFAQTIGVPKGSDGSIAAE
jgi:hypothetical protein